MDQKPEHPRRWGGDDGPILGGLSWAPVFVREDKLDLQKQRGNSSTFQNLLPGGVLFQTGHEEWEDFFQETIPRTVHGFVAPGDRGLKTFRVAKNLHFGTAVPGMPGLAHQLPGSALQLQHVPCFPSVPCVFSTCPMPELGVLACSIPDGGLGGLPARAPNAGWSCYLVLQSARTMNLTSWFELLLGTRSY